MTVSIGTIQCPVPSLLYVKFARKLFGNFFKKKCKEAGHDKFTTLIGQCNYIVLLWVQYNLVLLWLVSTSYSQEHGMYFLISVNFNTISMKIWPWWYDLSWSEIRSHLSTACADISHGPAQSLSDLTRIGLCLSFTLYCTLVGWWRCLNPTSLLPTSRNSFNSRVVKRLA